MEFRASYNAKIENMPQLPYAVEEAINRLRVNVSFLGNEVKKIMVISSEPDEGKSFVAMQLWRQMAEAGSKSILVDMDLRKSVMVDKYKIIREDGKHVYGLSEYLAGDDSLEHYILHTDIGEGDILPNVENVINPSMLLEGQKLADTFTELAEKYRNGVALVVRLTGADYHHYCYVADGKKGKNHYLHGVFHALVPVVREQVPVYQENAREFCRIRTYYFDEIIQMEVGAMLVGKINNIEEGVKEVQKGQEKGYFSYGGSTVVVLFKEGAVDLDRDLIENTQEGIETVIKMGERIGYRKMLDESKRFFSL